MYSGGGRVVRFFNWVGGAGVNWVGGSVASGFNFIFSHVLFILASAQSFKQHDFVH
jgi:hypothetical protein